MRRFLILSSLLGLMACSHSSVTVVKPLPGEKWWGAVVNAGYKTVYLPAGTWKDDLGQEFTGPQVLELHDVALDRLPYYERIDS